MEPIDKQKLLDIIGGGTILEVHDGGTVAVIRWEDGEESEMYYQNGSWRFPEDNRVYQGQYAYACGYLN